MKLSIHLKPKGGEEYYVYICLTHQSKRVLMATAYTIGAENVKKGKIINRAKYAEIYNNELLKYEERLSKVPAAEKLSLSALKEILSASKTTENEVVEFFSEAQKCIDRIAENPKSVRTATVYYSSLNLFKEYSKRNKLYTFEMTSKMMQGYIDYLAKMGKEPATIMNRVTIVRRLFNKVKDVHNDYDLGILNVKNYPFRKLKYPYVVSQAGNKALSLVDLRKVISVPIPEGKGYRAYELEYGRDYFMLSFYLIGINPADMWDLKKEQFKDGWITYSRRKTQRRRGGAEISIPVSTYAMELLERHQGRGEYLLDMRDNYASLESFVLQINRKLHKMYSFFKLEMEEGFFTWYSARHTWASIAANECAFTDAEVARALNHQSEHRVTRGYIRPNWNLLKKMNDAVLEMVHNKAEAE
jgi:integrase